MVSQINPSLPVTGLPTTISVRENFGIARDEISALQAGGPFLPLTGGTIYEAGRSSSLTVLVDAGQSARFRASVQGQIAFAMGAEVDSFAIIAETVGWRFSINNIGTVKVWQNLEVVGSASLGLPLPITSGGTGGATPAAALLNLGALPLTDGNALLTGGWFVVRHGANPGLTIENTGAAPVFALQVGGNPATLWFRTVNSATNAPVANLAAISSTGKFSVLGGASDPFELTVPSGMSARAWFTIIGTRTWSVGPRADGAFEIADQTGLIGRMVIGTGGLLQYFGSATVNGALTVDGAVSLPQGGTSGPLVFSGGLAPPAVDGRSAGTRLVLFPAAGTTELALGIMSGGMWFSCRASADFFSWYAGATEIATLVGTGTLRIMGDFVLNRQDAATGWITRPNVAGFRNLGFAAAGGGPLDTLTINAAETSISGNLNVTGTITGGNIATRQYIDDALAALRAELSRGD
jgi:hypothetical protein